MILATVRSYTSLWLVTTVYKKNFFSVFIMVVVIYQTFVKRLFFLCSEFILKQFKQLALSYILIYLIVSGILFCFTKES